MFGFLERAARKTAAALCHPLILLLGFVRSIADSIRALARQFRLSYLPPMMIYLAYGASTITAVVGTFFVKDHLTLAPQTLAALLFWASIPWALKMPLGHLVDLLWPWKTWLIYLGALTITSSIGIMYGLIAYPAQMTEYLDMNTWYVIAVLLAPIGYVIQDVVADAMTVEAVPSLDSEGKPIEEETLRRMHTAMQTFGRVAFIFGGIAIGLLNVFAFSDVQNLDQAGRLGVYRTIYGWAFAIPLVSIGGVVLAAFLKRSGSMQPRSLEPGESTNPNWMILGGSLVYVCFTVLIGGLDTILEVLGIDAAHYMILDSLVTYKEEIVFAGSLSIVLFLMGGLLKHLDVAARGAFIGTAMVMFVFRAVPTPGDGATWWQIDVLGFDQQFQSILLLTANAITLFIMALYLRFLSEKPLMYTYGLLSAMGLVFALPTVGMYYGLHNWTAQLTGGWIDARFIALVNTALESPLGQVAMIPSLAWTASIAPRHLKATFFAVISSFANVALSASWLGTKYLNQVWPVERGEYGNLGAILIVAAIIGFSAPIIAIIIAKLAKLKSW